MAPKTEPEWTDEQGRKHHVETKRGQGQSEQDWCDQHELAVAEAKHRWPPV